MERLVRWVKTAFFGSRTFTNALDLEGQLREWNDEVNRRETALATGMVPEARMPAERVRLRPLAVRMDEFAPRIPVIVGPGAQVVHDGLSYPMPVETIGKRAMLYLHSGRVRIVGDGFDIEHVRPPRPSPSEFPE